jgi:pyruvate,water dikinase
MTVRTVLGAGGGPVAAATSADTYTLNRITQGYRPQIVGKERQWIADPASRTGLRQIPVPQPRQHRPALDEEELNTAVLTALEIEHTLRRPVDMEFCLDQRRQLFVLQSRPLGGPGDPVAVPENPLPWRGLRFVEGCRGPTTPMTFSILRRGSEIAGRHFAAAMGGRAGEIESSRVVFENLLIPIQGRVAGAAENWCRLVQLIPGRRPTAAAVASGSDPSPPRTGGFWQIWLTQRPAGLRTALRTLWHLLRQPSGVRRFQSVWDRYLQTCRDAGFSQRTLSELGTWCEEVEKAVRQSWRAPVINGLFVATYTDWLHRLCRNWTGGDAVGLPAELLVGADDPANVERDNMLAELAAMVRGEASLKDVIAHGELHDLPDRVASQPAAAEFNRLLGDYLDRFGSDCPQELKLEEYTLRDRPEWIFQMLRNDLRQETDSGPLVASRRQRVQAIRQDAEMRAMQALGGFRLIPRKTIFRHVLQATRAGIENREVMRNTRTRLFGLFREVLLTAGTRLTEEGLLDDRDDIFFLTIDEFLAFVRGAAVTTRLGPLAALRRVEFETNRGTPRPPQERRRHAASFTGGSLNGGEPLDAALPKDTLQGIGCGPGTVERAIRILRRPTDSVNLSGEILVVPRPLPGQMLLYPSASGMLIAEGDFLSHAAVVARESGIPAIVGIPGLLELVQDGDIVKMDGTTGVVQIVTGDETF